jgi:hypothetical protein
VDQTWVPADRFIEAQTWWIASELIRRHPQLRLAETTHDEVGTSLVAYDPEWVIETQVIFNRVAGIHMPGSPDFEIRWSEVFAAPSAHTVLLRIEAGLGMHLEGLPPATTEVTIVYRVIARVLASLVDDRHSWMIRDERPDDPSVLEDINWAGDTSSFASLEDLIARWFEDSAAGRLDNQGLTHLWVLLRDLEPVAAFDLYGVVHTQYGRESLLEYYKQADGNLTMTIAETFGIALR